MATPKLIEPTDPPPRTEWRGILSDTAVEVFATMAGTNIIIPGHPIEAVQARHMTGAVGIAGAMRALLSVRCRIECSIKIASQMLGIDPSEPGAEKSAGDALGEICNIVAGYFKAKIGLGDKCMLSVPTIVIGKDYTIHSGAGGERVVVSALNETEPMWITLDIRQ